MPGGHRHHAVAGIPSTRAADGGAFRRIMSALRSTMPDAVCVSRPSLGDPQSTGGSIEPVRQRRPRWPDRDDHAGTVYLPVGKTAGFFRLRQAETSRLANIGLRLRRRRRSAARFCGPSGVALDNRDERADTRNSRSGESPPSVWRPTRRTRRGDGRADGKTGAARFGYPIGVAVDTTGTVYVADFSNPRFAGSRQAVCDYAGRTRLKCRERGWRGGAARFDWPQGIAVDGAGCSSPIPGTARFDADHTGGRGPHWPQVSSSRKASRWTAADGLRRDTSNNTIRTMRRECGVHAGRAGWKQRQCRWRRERGAVQRSSWYRSGQRWNGLRRRPVRRHDSNDHRRRRRQHAGWLCGDERQRRRNGRCRTVLPAR